MSTVQQLWSSSLSFEITRLSWLSPHHPQVALIPSTSDAKWPLQNALWLLILPSQTRDLHLPHGLPSKIIHFFHWHQSLPANKCSRAEFTRIPLSLRIRHIVANPICSSHVWLVTWHSVVSFIKSGRHWRKSVRAKEHYKRGWEAWMSINAT